MNRIKTARNRVLRRVFELGQRIGVDVLPRHYYSGIPDIARLRATSDWRRPFAMVGVAGASIDEQIAHLSEIASPELIDAWPRLDVHQTAVAENGQGGGYGPIEADVLFAFVRHHQPRRVVQIGCGVSTAIILRAAKTANSPTQITCIEPYPSRFLKAAAARGEVELVRQEAELCPPELLTSLAAGDLLFVDSTHAVRPGSDVNRIVLDVLARLADGVFVHFHDIYFPYDYSRSLLTDELFFSTETALLHAFLINNIRARILFSLSMLHYGAPETISALFPVYEPQSSNDGLAEAGGKHFPSAIYLAIGRDEVARP